MDGVEATARIREMGRKDPYFAVVPIVALTANAMKGVREEFLQKGFNDFLPKPIELDKLDNVLRAWIPEDKQKAPAPALGDLVAEPIPEDLQRLPGIDVARGMSYCGTGQVYRKTLFLFREQIPGRLRRIRKAQETEQWEDYVIEVHSLKSAARWIGRPGGGPGEDRRRHPGTPPPVPGPGGDLGLPEGAGITSPVFQSAPPPARSFPARKGKGPGSFPHSGLSTGKFPPPHEKFD